MPPISTASTCAHCGDPFTYERTSGPVRAYCTERCKANAAVEMARARKPVRTCACGSVEVPTTGRPVCADCRKENRAPRQDYNRIRRLALYGLTPERFEEMVAEQRGRCGSCGDKPDERGLFIDHDHACCPGIGSCGECVRGLLCHYCNCLLGNAKDSIDRLAAAIKYLQVNSQFKLALKVVK